MAALDNGDGVANMRGSFRPVSTMLDVEMHGTRESMSLLDGSPNKAQAAYQK